MLNFFSGSSKSVNSAKAAAECIETAVADRCLDVTLAIIHVTSGHKISTIIETLKHACPNAKIVGCSGMGVVEYNFVSEAMRALSIMFVTGDEFDIHSMDGLTANNSALVAENCAKTLMERNKNAVQSIMLFGPGIDIDAEAAISGIEKVFGPKIPIGGATAGFSGTNPETLAIHDERVYTKGLVLIAFTDPSIDMVQRSHHGNLPQENYRFTVTKSEGVRIDELDGKPAWPTFLKAVGMPPETGPFEAILLISFGLDLDVEDADHYDNSQILRAAVNLANDGKSMILATTVPIGSTLVSCQREEKYLFTGTERLAERLIEGMDNKLPLAVFQTDCAARGRMGHNVVEKNEIINLMQAPICQESKVPWIGVYGFGEFGMLNGKNRFHNYTTTLSALVRRDA